MEQGWFYAEGERSVGPLSFDALINALRRLPEPGKTDVWRSGFADWRAARDVPELAGRLFAPTRDAVTLDPSVDRWSTYDARSEEWDGDGLPEAPPRRRWLYAVMIAVLAALVAGGGLYASRMAFMTGEPESRVVLPTATTPEPPKQEVARADPAAVIAQMSETSTQAAAATEALSQKLWAAIEPAGMQMPNPASASRADFEKYGVDLRTAEANVTDAYNKYTALQKAERELIEEKVQTSELDEKARAEFLTQVSDRHSTTLELVTRMLQARLDLYRAAQKLQAIAIEQSGKAKRGGKAASDRLAAAAEEVNAASKRLDLAEDRILQQPRAAAPQPGWQDMMTKPPALPGTTTGQ